VISTCDAIEQLVVPVMTSLNPRLKSATWPGDSETPVGATSSKLRPPPRIVAVGSGLPLALSNSIPGYPYIVHVRLEVLVREKVSSTVPAAAPDPD
jgi:hypothetical protein